MRFEYDSLLVMTVIYLFAWIPSSIGKYKSFGWAWISSNRTPIPNMQPTEWAGRAERAYTNLKDNFPGFAVVIVILGLLNKFDRTTSVAAGIYVASRFGHLTSYLLGNVNFRFICYCISLLANLYLLVKCFG